MCNTAIESSNEVYIPRQIVLHASFPDIYTELLVGWLSSMNAKHFQIRYHTS